MQIKCCGYMPWWVMFFLWEIREASKCFGPAVNHDPLRPPKFKSRAYRVPYPTLSNLACEALPLVRLPWPLPQVHWLTPPHQGPHRSPPISLPPSHPTTSSLSRHQAKSRKRNLGPKTHKESRKNNYSKIDSMSGIYTLQLTSVCSIEILLRWL